MVTYLDLTTQAPPTIERSKLDRSTGRLIGSKCTECSAVSWPSRARCEKCGSPTDTSHQLGAEGTLLSYTTVHVSRPGLAAPYQLGQVIVDGCVFFGHVRNLPDGATVPIDVIIKVGTPDSGVLFWFEPVGIH